jgi:hypothetical protein
MDRAVALALAVALPWACGAPQPDDLSVAEHLREARAHEREAAEHEAEYDPDVRLAQPQGTFDHPELFWGSEVYNPTEAQLAAAARHRERAAAHRRAAAQLAAWEEAECARFPPETRTACPLLLGVTETEDVPGGIRISFAPDVSRDALLDHIRCHLAFARSHHRWGMAGCPLYVKGVRAEGRGARQILLTVEGAGEDAVAQLRRRARAYVIEEDARRRAVALAPGEPGEPLDGP